MINKLFVLFLLALPISLIAQDTAVTAKPPAYYYSVKKKPNILDSFKADSLKGILLKPFELPIENNQLPIDTAYEKLEYDEIVKYKKTQSKELWFLLAVMTILVLLVVIKLSFYKHISGPIKSLFNRTYYREYLDTVQVEINTPSFLLTLIKSMVFGLLIAVVLGSRITILKNIDFSLHYYLLIVAITLLYFLGEKLFRFLFSSLTLNRDFNKNVFLLQSSIDILFILIIFPLCLVYYYNNGIILNINQLQGALVLVFSLYFITRTLISLLLNKEVVSINKFLLITYICTFEIFPYLIWVKIVQL